MRETEKKKTQNNNQIKRSGRTQRRDNKLLEESPHKTLNEKETQPKASHAKPMANEVVSDTNMNTEPSEVYENMVIHYLDDVDRSEGSLQVLKPDDMLVDDKDNISREEESDSETVKDSASSQGNSLTADGEKIERHSRVPRKLMKKDSSEISARASRLRSGHDKTKSPLKWSHATPKKPMKSSINGAQRKDSSDSKSNNMTTSSSSESSEGSDDKPNEEPKDGTSDEASNADKSAASDDETASAEHSDLHHDSAALNLKGSDGVKNVENDDEEEYVRQSDVHQDKIALDQKIVEMEKKIEKLEEELTEVAALEVSLYSVVPEHGSSAHKVHTPARRLSRLYIHACKYWTQNKRATVAKNTVSGLILVARTCGNDVARLTFWLSNTVVLKEIISQAFGSSCQSTLARFTGSNGTGKTSGGNSSSLKLKGSAAGTQTNKEGLTQFVEDWQETGTFTAALEKVEYWIFSRIVESIWWQTLTPHMQSPVEDLTTSRSMGKLLGPALGDQQQGSFSIDLWKNAFMDASCRLCPVRTEGHECGCLPVLARLVIEQCVARLDVAMFNAILRESAHQIPTDPVSDPILDSRVLPIPAGDLSFGSGAQLKNAIGNWSRCLADLFGVETGHPAEDHQDGSKAEDQHAGQGKAKCFHLLDELSDLLMLPKDMLMDRSIRKEVCPSITLPLVKRILCNFSPDEFCPDPVPGEVLEVLNAESVVERRLSGDSAGSFPYAAAPVLYSHPSSADVAEKVAEAGGRPQPETSASLIQKKGYTSDDDLEDLDSPLTSFVENLPSSPTAFQNGSLKPLEQTCSGGLNARYKLLREVWSA